MKNKPALLQTGRTKMALRNFLIKNLKENDIHFSNQQITQCVFLGVLRLKPVPSIFSNNSGSSLPVKYKHKIRETRDNVPKVNNKAPVKKPENSVINGKVTKKNNEKIKAAIKKTTAKKHNIVKIKLNTKKKPAITEKPVLSSVTKPLNPVQLLFEKLKKEKLQQENNNSSNGYKNKTQHGFIKEVVEAKENEEYKAKYKSNSKTAENVSSKAKNTAAQTSFEIKTSKVKQTNIGATEKKSKKANKAKTLKVQKKIIKIKLPSTLHLKSKPGKKIIASKTVKNSKTKKLSNRTNKDAKKMIDIEKKDDEKLQKLQLVRMNKEQKTIEVTHNATSTLTEEDVIIVSGREVSIKPPIEQNNSFVGSDPNEVIVISDDSKSGIQTPVNLKDDIVVINDEPDLITAREQSSPRSKLLNCLTMKRKSISIFNEQNKSIERMKQRKSKERTSLRLKLDERTRGNNVPLIQVSMEIIEIRDDESDIITVASDEHYSGCAEVQVPEHSSRDNLLFLQTKGKTSANVDCNDKKKVCDFVDLSEDSSVSKRKERTSSRLKQDAMVNHPLSVPVTNSNASNIRFQEAFEVRPQKQKSLSNSDLIEVVIVPDDNVTTIESISNQENRNDQNDEVIIVQDSRNVKRTSPRLRPAEEQVDILNKQKITGKGKIPSTITVSGETKIANKQMETFSPVRKNNVLKEQNKVSKAKERTSPKLMLDERIEVQRTVQKASDIIVFQNVSKLTKIRERCSPRFHSSNKQLQTVEQKSVEQTKGNNDMKTGNIIVIIDEPNETKSKQRTSPRMKAVEDTKEKHSLKTLENVENQIKINCLITKDKFIRQKFGNEGKRKVTSEKKRKEERNVKKKISLPKVLQEKNIAIQELKMSETVSPNFMKKLTEKSDEARLNKIIDEGSRRRSLKAKLKRKPLEVNIKLTRSKDANILRKRAVVIRPPRKKRPIVKRLKRSLHAYAKNKEKLGRNKNKAMKRKNDQKKRKAKSACVSNLTKQLTKIGQKVKATNSKNSVDKLIEKSRVNTSSKEEIENIKPVVNVLARINPKSQKSNKNEVINKRLENHKNKKAQSKNCQDKNTEEEKLNIPATHELGDKKPPILEGVGLDRIYEKCKKTGRNARTNKILENSKNKAGDSKNSRPKISTVLDEDLKPLFGQKNKITMLRQIETSNIKVMNSQQTFPLTRSIKLSPMSDEEEERKIESVVESGKIPKIIENEIPEKKKFLSNKNKVVEAKNAEENLTESDSKLLPASEEKNNIEKVNCRHPKSNRNTAAKTKQENKNKATKSKNDQNKTKMSQRPEVTDDKKPAVVEVTKLETAEDEPPKMSVDEPTRGKGTKRKAGTSRNIKSRELVIPNRAELISLVNEEKPVFSPKVALNPAPKEQTKTSRTTTKEKASPNMCISSVKDKTPVKSELLAESRLSSVAEKEASLKDKTNLTSLFTSPRQVSTRAMFKGAALKTEQPQDPKIETSPYEFVDEIKDENLLPALPRTQARFSNLTIDSLKIDRKPNLCRDEEEEYFDDDDDAASKAEWVPDDYAEYKFKFAAKKLMRCKQGHRCKVCLMILPSYYLLNKHRLEHVKTINPYNCPQCIQAFPTVEELGAHIRIHKGKQPYTCKKCYKGFWSKASLESHERIHILKKAAEPKKKFRCDLCAKEFSKLSDMERHIRVHTGEKPSICNICNKRFQQSHNLNKHLLTHLHVKPYHCDICNKSFGRPDVLSRHVLTHSVEKPFQCKECPKSFIRTYQLENHRLKYHGGSSSAVGDDKKHTVINPVAV